MQVLVIDGQGGRIGRTLIEAIKKLDEKIHVIAVGTNSMATASMLRGGADEAATGENPVVVCAAQVDVIMGPIGMMAADALLGEVTPAMAVAVGRSRAQKILIPVNRCNNMVAGVRNQTPAELIEDAVQLLKNVMAGQNV